eukprot:TRINITY_DN127_c0_g1_i3.p1 TRINITY_DN127_c0_g1~~TRINITY_DN127_c0_g1_i3.p1  ORF type:complete len:199 (+),score=19.97 TRINITY_DN127_c0_g1_i3:169-765(+)
MAGMLPGVECARRRRFHQGGSTDLPNNVANNRTRRSSFCLYASNHESHLNTSSMQRAERSGSSQSFQAGQLGCAAREAKDRLDERLKTQKKSETMRHKVMGIIKPKGRDGLEGMDTEIPGYLPREIVCSTKRSSRRFSWAKLGWKASDQDACAVCLERFKSGDLLVHLPCAHRFHSVCLVPWLECSAQCPCCRMEISS